MTRAVSRPAVPGDHYKPAVHGEEWHRHLRQDGWGYFDHRHRIHAKVHAHAALLPVYLPRSAFDPRPKPELRRAMAEPALLDARHSHRGGRVEEVEGSPAAPSPA